MLVIQLCQPHFLSCQAIWAISFSGLGSSSPPQNAWSAQSSAIGFLIGAHCFVPQVGSSRGTFSHIQPYHVLSLKPCAALNFEVRTIHGENQNPGEVSWHCRVGIGKILYRVIFAPNLWWPVMPNCCPSGNPQEICADMLRTGGRNVKLVRNLFTTFIFPPIPTS